MIERCAGLDVHQETVVACVLFGPLNESPKGNSNVFDYYSWSTITLNDWLSSFQVTNVVMESTGVYWKPVWNY
ncbi:hypothetical protein KHA80_01575 [Anaerobacillus sp. HL2]|nr:hypothetical protein KHA80_01575 [Anaerobacillus sp. HL2]